MPHDSALLPRSHIFRAFHIDFVRRVCYPPSLRAHAKTPAVGAYSKLGLYIRLLEVTNESKNSALFNPWLINQLIEAPLLI
jgi:hypothetical protein